MSGSELKKCVVVCAVMIVVLSLGYEVVANQVPCYFIFGDSLVDNGNNNYLASLAKANYRPYGIDFPQGATGRFSNGKTTVDAIAQNLGFKNYIPPYATTRGRALLKGVNYASAAAGIRDETGRQLGARISMNGQVRNFRSTVLQVRQILGNANAAAKHLSKCIYSLGMGSNDYLNNYFMPTFYTTGSTYTPKQYAIALIQEYSQQIRSLYNYGARKFVVIGVGQIGCSPNELARYRVQNGSSCVKRINSAVQLFNRRLKFLVVDFNKNLTDAKFIYINAYDIFQDLLDHPSTYGFRVTNAGCCGVGRNNGQVTCLPLQTPCPNRDEYVFWDAYHPTEAANLIVGTRSYRAASTYDSYPYDINRLAQL